MHMFQILENVAVISTATNKVTATGKLLETGSNGIAITPDGKYAYVTDQILQYKGPRTSLR